MIATSLVMGGAVFYGAVALADLPGQSLISNIIAVTLLVSGGLVVYGGLSLLFGAASRDDLARILPRKST
jgi:hypothetical protein